jgi:SAM-dependent methyltransferase
MTKSETKSYYDDFSGWYERERHHGYHAMLDELQLEIIRPLARDRQVLEVGCGTGLIMRGIADEAASLFGVDISPGMLQPARERGLDVIQGSAEALPVADESVDLVYSFKVLAHVPDIRRALSEILRVLRPGGRMVVDFYNTISLRSMAKHLSAPGRISSDRTEAEVYTRWDTPREAAAHLPLGMEIESWRGVRVFTPVAVAHKLPGIGTALRAVERWAVDSPLARFGGFLVATCRKS